MFTSCMLPKKSYDVSFIIQTIDEMRHLFEGGVSIYLSLSCGVYRKEPFI